MYVRSQKNNMPNVRCSPIWRAALWYHMIYWLIDLLFIVISSVLWLVPNTYSTLSWLFVVPLEFLDNLIPRIRGYNNSVLDWKLGMSTFSWTADPFISFFFSMKFWRFDVAFGRVYKMSASKTSFEFSGGVGGLTRWLTFHLCLPPSPAVPDDACCVDDTDSCCSKVPRDANFLQLLSVQIAQFRPRVCCSAY